MEIVSALRKSLAGKVGKKRFGLWFGGSTRLELDGDALTIATPSRFLGEWLRTTFRKHIEAACDEVLQFRPELKFRTCSTSGDGDEKSSTSQINPQSDPISRKSSSKTSPVKQQRQRGPGRGLSELKSFATGNNVGNRTALASAELVVHQPGQFSPLLLHGPSGVGKTHLLEGILSEIRKRKRNAAAVYLTAEEFMTHFVEAIRGGGLPSFRQKYRHAKLLLIDDIQFLSGKRSTLVELLSTVDTLIKSGQQLVLTADRPLSKLTELGPELLTRLNGGNVCGIEPPDHSARLEIVAQMVKRLGMTVPKNVQRFITSRLTSNARTISGALCRLQATSQAFGQPITLSMAEESLSELIRNNSQAVRLDDIQKAVCETFGLEPDSLQSTRKSKSVSHPRMLAMWLARKHTRVALSEIGQFFGRRSHSTVISAQKRVERWLTEGAPVDVADHRWTADEAIREVERYLIAC